MSGEQGRGGFTIVEVLVVLTIAALLAVSSFSLYVSSQNQQSLEKDVARVVSVFEEARTLSIANSQGSSYGVHFDRTQVVRFTGTSYNVSSASNVVERLSSSVAISTSSPYGLSGGTSNIVFTTLTGTTSASGTLGLYLVSSTTNVKTIRIYSTGLVETP